LPIDPLPPFPLIGIGPADHPQAGAVDVLGDAALGNAIAAHPHASAVLVQVLRSIEGMPAEAALTCESLAFATLQGGREHRAWRAMRQPELALPPGELHLDRTDDVLTVTIDRPFARNAIDRAMRDALFDAFTLAATDTTIARVLLRGTGRCFSMGADLAEFGTVADPAEAHSLRMRTLPARALIRRPGIYAAHIQGGCVGSGLELAAFATRLTASADAWFQLPEVSMGILPGAGGCVSLSRRIGRQRAAAFILSGRRIGARTALDWGLVDAIVDHPPADQSGAHPIG
jgi:enoyl-CoA hydratase